MRASTSAVVLAQLTAWALGPSAVRADADPEALRVAVVASGPCSAAAEFEPKLFERNPGWTRADPGIPAREVRLHFGGDAGHIEGRVELVDTNGELQARSVTGADCSEVLDALVLITSVLAAHEAGDRSGAEPAAVSANDEDSVDDSHRLRVAFGATLAVASGILPVTTAFPCAFVGAELARAAALPIASLRLLVAYAAAENVVDAGGARVRIATHLLAGRADACSPRFGGLAVSAEACGLLELANLAGSATGFDTPDDNAALWSAAGLLARVLLAPWPPLRFELEAGGFAALTRVRMRLEQPGSPEVFSTADLGAFAGVSAGLAFP